MYVKYDVASKVTPLLSACFSETIIGHPMGRTCLPLFSAPILIISQQNIRLRLLLPDLPRGLAPNTKTNVVSAKPVCVDHLEFGYNPEM